MKKLIWLDDKRNPFEENWLRFSPIEMPFEVIWVKKHNEFVSWIKENGLPDAICFDHDIEDFSGINGEELRGIDCAKWLVDYCLDNNIKDVPRWNTQSSNPCGGDNINGLLISFMKNAS